MTSAPPPPPPPPPDAPPPDAPARRRLAFSSGGEGDVLAAAGPLVTVRSTRPFPPGTPLSGTLHGEIPRSFTIKVTASRRLAEGAWEIRGKLGTPSADVLAAFAAAVVPR